MVMPHSPRTAEGGLDSLQTNAGVPNQRLKRRDLLRGAATVVGVLERTKSADDWRVTLA